jgi:16S rRNA G966 N2-methylase RsmD
MDWRNKLYLGDNLKILRDYVADASVDLIYLDPPFNSSATYNVLFKEKSGEESAAQESLGAKFKSASADVADKVAKQLVRDLDRVGAPKI